MLHPTSLKALRAAALAAASLAVPFAWAVSPVFTDGYAADAAVSEDMVTAYADGYAADAMSLTQARFDAILEDALKTATAAGPVPGPYGDEPNL